MEIIKKHLKFYQKEESTVPTTVSAILYFIIQTDSTHSPEFIGLKLDDFIFLFICSFIFCWIRINNSGSRIKFQIHADPNPQHCFFFLLKSRKIWVRDPRESAKGNRDNIYLVFKIHYKINQTNELFFLLVNLFCI